MKKKHVKFLKRIVETPSPTGSEVAVADIVRERLLPIADEIHTDTMGSVHATYEGQLHLRTRIDAVADEEEPYEDIDVEGQFPEGTFDGYHDPYFDDIEDDDDEDEAAAEADDMEDEPLQPDELSMLEPPLTLMLAAHMDEIGLMVTYISDDGFLSIAALGGVDAAILPGMRVDVHAEGGTLRGVVGRKPIHLIDADERKNVTPIDKLVIDLGMPGKAVKKKVKVGDSITIAAGFERFGKDMATSRAFDDKVGVFIACRVMEKLAVNPDYAGNFVAAITVQEEIGTRGAMTSAHAVMPDVALAFDVTHATDYPGIDKTKYGDIVCGGGPVIARGPNINPVVFERLVKAAEDEGIPYQLEAEPSVTGTDARAIQVTREGIPTGLVSIPLRYMHTPTEAISLDDVSATVRLIARFAADLDEAADFVPGHAQDYESDERLESVGYYEDYDFLVDEVVRLTEEVSDLQALAGLDPQIDAGWSGSGAFDGAVAGAAAAGVVAAVDGDLDPQDAPFTRHQGMFAAGFADADYAEDGESPADAEEGAYGTEADDEGWYDADDAEGYGFEAVDADDAGDADDADDLDFDDVPAGEGYDFEGLDDFDEDGFDDDYFAASSVKLPDGLAAEVAVKAERAESAPAQDETLQHAAHAAKAAPADDASEKADDYDEYEDDEDDVPAAYAEGEAGAPAFKLKLEGNPVVEEEPEPEPEPQPERTRTSLPIVMVSNIGLEEDE